MGKAVWWRGWAGERGEDTIKPRYFLFHRLANLALIMYLLIWQFSFFSETKRVFICSLLCNEIRFHLCQKEKKKKKKKEGVNNNS